MLLQRLTPKGGSLVVEVKVSLSNEIRAGSSALCSMMEGSLLWGANADLISRKM